MDLLGKFNLSATILLTGFAIVFSVLLFLIFIIWGYGKIVSTAQTKYSERKRKKELEKIRSDNPEIPDAVVTSAVSESKAEPVTEGIPDEVIAVISAAVYSMYGSKEKVRIRSVKRSGKRSAWANAGILDNTRPF